ncbi:MAG: GNAT family N-acetyltransferase [Pseudomonadota bacterium]
MNRERLNIRAAEAGDEAQILELILGLAEYEQLADEVKATPAQIAESLFGEHPSAEALLAEWDGEAVGFALFFQNFSTFLGRPGLYLEDLYVREAARGRGIGKALLLHLARLAHERGCGRMEWAVLNWNQPAIDFYRSMGAQPMNEWTVYRLDQDALAALKQD